MSDFGAVKRRRPSGGGAARGFQQKNLPIDRSRKEYFRQPVYDRISLGTSLTGAFKWFTNPIGASQTVIRYETAAAVAKSLRDTNLVNAGVDQSKDYAFYGIGCALIPKTHNPASQTYARSVRSDKDLIKEGGYLTLTLMGTKRVLELPMIMLPEMNAEQGVSATTTASTFYGGPSFSKNFYPLVNRDGEPMAIPAGTSFGVEGVWDGTITLGQEFDMVIMFDADVRRPT